MENALFALIASTCKNGLHSLGKYLLQNDILRNPPPKISMWVFPKCECTNTEEAPKEEAEGIPGLESGTIPMGPRTWVGHSLRAATSSRCRGHSASRATRPMKHADPAAAAFYCSFGSTMSQ